MLIIIIIMYLVVRLRPKKKSWLWALGEVIVREQRVNAATMEGWEAVRVNRKDG